MGARQSHFPSSGTLGVVASFYIMAMSITHHLGGLAPQKGSTEKQSHDLDTVRSGQKLQIWSTCTPWHSWLFFQGLVSAIEQ